MLSKSTVTIRRLVFFFFFSSSFFRPVAYLEMVLSVSFQIFCLPQLQNAQGARVMIVDYFTIMYHREIQNGVPFILKRLPLFKALVSGQE
ncbi:hypothetical protein GGI43DRAFT_392244 [Trichoderma evansii]